MKFIHELLDDVLPRQLPFTPSFHIGGDELNKECYRLEKGIESSDKSVIKPFLEHFMRQVIAKVQDYNMTIHTWEDLLLEWDIGYPKSTVIHAWKTGE